MAPIVHTYHSKSGLLVNSYPVEGAEGLLRSAGSSAPALRRSPPS